MNKALIIIDNAIIASAIDSKLANSGRPSANSMMVVE